MLHITKKGQVFQVVIFMSIMLALAFTAILTYYIMTQFYSGMADMNVTTPEMAQAETTMKAQFHSVDYALVFLMVALVGGMIVTSFFIPSHPIFFVINIIGIFVLIFIGMVMSNVYGELTASQDANDSGITASADEIVPYTSFIINYLPYLSAIVIGIISVVMFAKGQGGGQY